jgi:hypothetical protein
VLGQLFTIPRIYFHFSIFHLLSGLLRSFRAISFTVFLPVGIFYGRKR